MRPRSWPSHCALCRRRPPSDACGLSRRWCCRRRAASQWPPRIGTVYVRPSPNPSRISLLLLGFPLMRSTTLDASAVGCTGSGRTPYLRWCAVLQLGRHLRLIPALGPLARHGHGRAEGLLMLVFRSRCPNHDPPSQPMPPTWRTLHLRRQPSVLRYPNARHFAPRPLPNLSDGRARDCRASSTLALDYRLRWPAPPILLAVRADASEILAAYGASDALLAAIDSEDDSLPGGADWLSRTPRRSAQRRFIARTAAAGRDLRSATCAGGAVRQHRAHESGWQRRFDLSS